MEFFFYDLVKVGFLFLGVKYSCFIKSKSPLTLKKHDKNPSSGIIL